MTYVNRLLVWFTVAFGCVTIGCTKKPPGFGADTQLFVVADSTNWLALESTMRDVFERTIRTPQPEKVFEVHWVPTRLWNRYATRKNLILAGLLDSEGEIDQKVEGMLAAPVRSKVEEGSAFFFPKTSPWAEHQLLMVLVSNTNAELQEKLNSNKDQLYHYFHKKLLEETRAEMYERLEQKDIARDLQDKYGWSLRIQHDYELHVERPQDRFIMLRRSLPERERWLFVHWIENGDPAEIDRDWVIAVRNQMTEKFYEGDSVNEDYTTAHEVEFQGSRALMLEGLWENVPKVVGGPFRNYTFYDDISGRIYMIDVAVFFPGGEKEPFLRQLDIMAHTFTTVNKIAEKTKEDAS